MTLIKSISGIRGTIGGKVGEALTPIDIVKFTYAYCNELRKKYGDKSYKVVVGRDARISGAMVEQLVCSTISSCGMNVVKCGFASTPTTEMAVLFEKADGGIILTASHNPKQWNALKLLNERGEFLTAEQGKAILDCVEKEEFDFSDIDHIGHIEEKDYTQEHIDAILAMEEVEVELIKKANFKVVVDAINSVGGIIIPKLLKELGVECVELNCQPTGDFAHNPEPLPKNLVDLSNMVVSEQADLGISVDPDVDRLALICENGEAFGEEYTLVSVADYLFGRANDIAKQQNVDIEEVIKPYKMVSCSNLSSSRALRDVVESYGGQYFASAVGEVNVTTLMHKELALIGGEGNGGVIYPKLHAGRDAILGLALFLSNLAKKKLKASELKKTYPEYHIAKHRIELADNSLIDSILEHLKVEFVSENIDTTDGVKIIFEKTRQWVHLRKSNTEPIIRIYSEANTLDSANELALRIKSIADKLIENNNS